MERFDDDQIQTSRRGCNSVNGNRDPGNCTTSRPRTWLTGVLPELGSWIRNKRDSERYGICTQQRFICERAGETLCARVREALRQRSQAVTEPQMDRSSPARPLLQPKRGTT